MVCQEGYQVDLGCLKYHIVLGQVYRSLGEEHHLSLLGYLAKHLTVYGLECLQPAGRERQSTDHLDQKL